MDPTAGAGRHRHPTAGAAGGGDPLGYSAIGQRGQPSYAHRRIHSCVVITRIISIDTCARHPLTRPPGSVHSAAVRPRDAADNSGACHWQRARVRGRSCTPARCSLRCRRTLARHTVSVCLVLTGSAGTRYIVYSRRLDCPDESIKSDIFY